MAGTVEYLKTQFTADGLSEIAKAMREAKKSFSEMDDAADKSKKTISNTGDGADEAAAKINAAFQKLFLIQEKNAKAQKQAYEDSFLTIAESGTATAEEIARAYVAMGKGIAAVDKKLARDLPDTQDEIAIAAEVSARRQAAAQRELGITTEATAAAMERSAQEAYGEIYNAAESTADDIARAWEAYEKKRAEISKKLARQTETDEERAAREATAAVEKAARDQAEAVEKSARERAAAEKRLGVVTEETADSMRREVLASYELIRASGASTPQDIQNAWEAAAARIEEINQSTASSIESRWVRLSRTVAAALYSVSRAALRASISIAFMASSAVIFGVKKVGNGFLAMGGAAVAASFMVAGAVTRILTGFGRIIALGGKIFAVSTIGGGAGAAAFLKSVADTAAEYERIGTALQSTTGKDFERAQKFVSDFAKTVIFSEQEISEGLLKLRNFGFGQKSAEFTFEALTEQVSKLGGTFEDLDGVILAVGQAWAKSKLQGEEILQLVERGVPVWGLLEKATGKNAKELQKLSESGKLGRETIALLVQEIGKAASGSSAAQLNTYNGLVTQLSKAWSALLRTVASSGVFDVIKKELKGWIDYLGQPGTIAIATRFAEVGAEAMIYLSSALRELIEQFGSRSLNVLSDWLYRAWVMFMRFLENADGAFDGVVRFVEKAVNAIGAFGQAATRIIGPVLSVFDTISAAVGRAFQKLDNETTGKFAENIGATIEALVASVATLLSRIDASSVTAIVDAIGSLFATIGDLAKKGAAGEGLSGFFTGLNSTVLALAAAIDAVRGDLTELFEKGFAGANLESPLLKQLQEFVNNDLPKILEAVESISRFINEPGTVLLDTLDSIIEKFGGLKQIFLDIATGKPILFIFEKLGIKGISDLPGFATGGVNIQGPGTGTSDSILARLSRGESVLTAAATRYWGDDFISSLNRQIMPPQMSRMLPAAAAPALDRIALDLSIPGGRKLSVEAQKSDLPIIHQLNREMSKMRSTMASNGVRGGI